MFNKYIRDVKKYVCNYFLFRIDYTYVIMFGTEILIQPIMKY